MSGDRLPGFAIVAIDLGQFGLFGLRLSVEVFVVDVVIAVFVFCEFGFDFVFTGLGVDSPYFGGLGIGIAGGDSVFLGVLERDLFGLVGVFFAFSIHLTLLCVPRMSEKDSIRWLPHVYEVEPRKP